MKYIGYFFLTIFGFTVLTGVGYGIKILFFPVHTAGNLIQTAYDANDKTLNADNAIYNYEWFKQQYEDIKALKNKIEIAQKAVDRFNTQYLPEKHTWSFEEVGERSRLDSIVQGLQSQLEDVIATYNARGKMANRAIFKDSIVPSFIDSLTFIKR